MNIATLVTWTIINWDLGLFNKTLGKIPNHASTLLSKSCWHIVAKLCKNLSI